MNLEEPKDANQRGAEERWLDEALAQYSAAEPRLGLENRILANLEAHAAGRRRWFYAFAAAAAVLLFAVLIMTMRNAMENNPRQIATPKKSPSETVLPTVAESASVTSLKAGRPTLGRHSVTVRKDLSSKTETVLESGVKQEHFPADRPLSEQDRLLLSYLSQTSHQEMEHVVAAQQELAAARQQWEEETDAQENR